MNTVSTLFTATLASVSILPLHCSLSPYNINNAPVKFEVDTGAAVSILNAATFYSVQQSIGDFPLTPATSKLKTYTG